MSRGLTTDLRTETLAASLAPILLAFLDFQSGAVRVWTGHGTLSWGGNNYTGLGYLGNVSPVEETADVRANGLVFQLAGIPSSLIATVLGDNYSGRTVKLWIGALDAAGAVVADPYQIFAGRMDAVDIDEGPETSTLRVSAESRLIDLNRSRERRFTHEDQQIDFPGDRGLEYMARAQSTPFHWGGKTGGTFAGGSGGAEPGDTLDYLT